jgi:thioredoxin-related protein/ribosomal protein S21
MALVLAPQMFAGNTWLKTIAAAQKVAKEKNQLILVDMFAEWCGWCHRFEREVFPSKAFQDATADMVLLRLNTEDGKEGTQLSRKFGITSLPTFLLLTPDLTSAGMIRGYAPPEPFAKSLKETRLGHVEFKKRLKNETKLDYFQRLNLAKELNSRADFDQAVPRFRKLMTEKGVPAAVRDQAYYELSLAYTLQNKMSDAQKTIRELLMLSRAGEAVERARLLLGQIYLQQGKYVLARDEYRNFKDLYPESPLIGNIEQILAELEKKVPD